MSERSKTPTLKTMPDAPKAKVGPRVEVPDVPPLTTAPERPLSRRSPINPRDSIDDATTSVFDSGRFTREKPEVNDTLVDSDTFPRVDQESIKAQPAPPPQAPATRSNDDGSFKRELSTPIKAISMKTPDPDSVRPRSDDGSFRAELSTPVKAISMKPGGDPDSIKPRLNDDGSFKQEVSTPIRAISMKAQGERAENTPPRPIPQVKLRSMAEVAREQPRPQNLGFLAPPRDVRDVRARRNRDLVIWGSVCVMLACAVALGMWFLAK